MTSNNVADTFTVGGSNSFVQTGGVTFLANSAAAILSASSININGGTVEGFGTLSGSVINNGGTLLPGDAPGTLSIMGSYTQGSGGSLAINIGGETAGSGYGVLAVNGASSLGGTLDLSLINGFTPTNGELFEILSSTSPVTGTFATVNGLVEGNVTFTVEYNPTINGVSQDGVFLLTSSSVPEPSSLLMVGLGLAGLGAVLLRRTLNRRLGKVCASVQP
jgi:hypothetical protein